MSLKTALLNAQNIKIENNILTLTDYNAGNHDSVLYSCFIQDISISHPSMGNGDIIGFKNGKFICDFYASTSVIEILPRNIIKFIN